MKIRATVVLCMVAGMSLTNLISQTESDDMGYLVRSPLWLGVTGGIGYTSFSSGFPLDLKSVLTPELQKISNSTSDYYEGNSTASASIGLSGEYILNARKQRYVSVGFRLLKSSSTVDFERTGLNVIDTSKGAHVETKTNSRLVDDQLSTALWFALGMDGSGLGLYAGVDLTMHSSIELEQSTTIVKALDNTPERNEIPNYSFTEDPRLKEYGFSYSQDMKTVYSQRGALDQKFYNSSTMAIIVGFQYHLFVMNNGLMVCPYFQAKIPVQNTLVDIKDWSTPWSSYSLLIGVDIKVGLLSPKY